MFHSSEVGGESWQRLTGTSGPFNGTASASPAGLPLLRSSWSLRGPRILGHRHAASPRARTGSWSSLLGWRPSLRAARGWSGVEIRPSRASGCFSGRWSGGGCRPWFCALRAIMPSKPYRGWRAAGVHTL